MRLLYDDGEVNEGKESCEHVEGRRDVKMVSDNSAIQRTWNLKLDQRLHLQKNLAGPKDVTTNPKINR